MDHSVQFDPAIKHLQDDLDHIRTGRARPSLVEHLPVEQYGTTLPLRDLATISTPEPNLILIQPWDPNAVKAIEKSLQSATLGIQPTVDRTTLRLVLPPMTEERRLELTKVVKEKVEAARIAIRSVRETLWKDLRDQQRAGSLSEDDLFKSQKTLQKTVDEYNAKVATISENKEKELLTL